MERYRYLVFNKPYGIPSTFTDEAGRKTLKDFIQVSGVYAAGRLDIASEGLLLLTDDGSLIHRLTDPEQHLWKTYLVQVEGNITNEALSRMENGITLDGVKTRRCRVMQIPAPDLPDRLKAITPHAAVSWLRIELREGKKHQVRRMTAAIGLPALRLVRVAIGPISLGDLQPGQWRELSPAELALIK